MDREEIINRINQVPYWRHKIDLGDGLITPGLISDRAFDLLCLPEDLTGKRVLDIGAWDGYYSFEAERRGAARVVAIDVWYESPGNKGIGGASPIYLVRDILDSRVEIKKQDVFDLDPEEIGCFDIVLFLGVIYHLKDPFLALRKIAGITEEMLVVESHAIKTRHESWPMIRFYEGDELEGDPSNWWSPNILCLESMIRSAGFPRAEKVSSLTGDKQKRVDEGMPPSGFVISSGQNLLSAPTEGSNKIIELVKGQPLRILSTASCSFDFSHKDDSWFRVETAIGDLHVLGRGMHVQGWLHGRHLELGVPFKTRMKQLIPGFLKDRIKLIIGRPVNYRAVIKGYKS